ncbi:MAG TPA: T9SS type A sorting domain-containing protein [Bacteroidales bacterium]|nr:T9SS type A sorting domain-containing protein [Bacteroidales bacterium]HPS63642.1 T9SS type A sorting domain-containing protein [Bacteroidales bacterium]
MKTIIPFLVVFFMWTETVLSQYAVPNPACHGCPVQLFCGSLTCCGQPGAQYTWTCSTAPTWSSNLENPIVIPSSTSVYSLTVTLPNTVVCYGFVQVTVLPQMSLAAQVIPSGCSPNPSPGEIDLTVTLGCPPYNYLWDNGDRTEDNYHPHCGLNTVWVTDLYETVSASFLYDALDISADECDGTPYVCDAYISLTVTCGTPPYSYIWNNLETTETIANLCHPETYCVTVTDAGNHSKTCCWGLVKKKSTCSANSYLQNTKVSAGANVCFDAVNNIYVGGSGGGFTVFPGGTVSLIAGHSVLFRPGTRIYSGGHMHGLITMNGQYCTNKSGNSSTAADSTALEPSSACFFSVYPNPTTGKFSLEISNGTSLSNLYVEIFDIHGSPILTERFAGEKKHEFSLSGHPRGIYVIRVINGKSVGISKINLQ